MLEDIEETLLDIKSDQGNMGSMIQQRRHEYMLIRKNSQPLKEQFPKLLRTENGIISPDMLPIYNDLADQLQFVIQTTESCREIISSLVSSPSTKASSRAVFSWIFISQPPFCFVRRSGR